MLLYETCATGRFDIGMYYIMIVTKEMNTSIATYAYAVAMLMENLHCRKNMAQYKTLL